MNKFFTPIASKIAQATGHPLAFLLCSLMVIVWAAVGPFLDYSDTWQSVITISTNIITIITFLMVFLIQNTQNRDNAALQAKINELIRSSHAENQFIGIEDLTQEEVENFRQWCKEKSNKDKPAQD